MILVIFVPNCLTKIIFFLSRCILPASMNIGKTFLPMYLMDLPPTPQIRKMRQILVPLPGCSLKLMLFNFVHLADNGPAIKSLRFGDSGYGSVFQGKIRGSLYGEKKS